MYDPPVLAVTAGRRLFAATTGYITYRTGEWSLFGWGGDASRKMDKSSVSLGMAGMNKSGNYSGELQVTSSFSVLYNLYVCVQEILTALKNKQTGIRSSHIAGEYSYKLANQGKLRVSCSLSSEGGVVASIGSDHKMTEHTRIGMTMECGLPLGVIVKFR